MNRGKLAVAAMILLGLGMTILAVVVQRAQRNQALDLWGPEAGVLIRDAPEVRLLRLSKPASFDTARAGDDALKVGEPPPITQSADFVDTALMVGEQVWPITQSVDLVDAPGLIKLRLALIEDRAFDWSSAPRETPDNWQVAILFQDYRARATLLLDIEHQWVRCRETGREARIGPIVKFVNRFVSDRLQEGQAGGTANRQQPNSEPASGDGQDSGDGQEPSSPDAKP